ncbi:MAG: hypothetical protein IKU37_01825 [Candidatus Gastranaerophilales bacterium]|nr:hypothetical protein [Candidatus Gastranaerophilales bacterium]
MNINSIPHLRNSVVLTKANTKNNKNLTLPPTNNNYVTKLSNCNTALYFHPSFKALKQQSTIDALRAQNESESYNLQKEDSFHSLPQSLAEDFRHQRKHVVGGGAIVTTDLFDIKGAYKLFHGNDGVLYLFDPSEKVETPDGYNRHETFDDIQKGSAFIYSPNTCHVEQVESLSQREGISGVYVEKPMCINREELARLEKVVKTPNRNPLYFGDYFYFAQIAALRLMGVPMPYKDSVHIEFDNSENKKFTNSVENAIAFFKPDEIKSIECRFCEQGADDVTERKWLQDRSKGGGVLLDLQVHVFNLLNLMGLELTSIDKLEGKKYPYPFNKMHDSNIPPKERERGVFADMRPGEVEDKVTIKGKINHNIDANYTVAQYMEEREDTITIRGKNSQKIRITVNDFDKKVELLDENDNVIARAGTNLHAYALMLHHAQTHFNDPNTKETPMFFDTQKKSLEQIFEIQEQLYSKADSSLNN